MQFNSGLILITFYQFLCYAIHIWPCVFNIGKFLMLRYQAVKKLYLEYSCLLCERNKSLGTPVVRDRFGFFFLFSFFVVFVVLFVFNACLTEYGLLKMNLVLALKSASLSSLWKVNSVLLQCILQLQVLSMKITVALSFCFSCLFLMNFPGNVCSLWKELGKHSPN